MVDSDQEHSNSFTARLQRVLVLIPDRVMAAKLEIVYQAADACVAKLRDIDLSRFEVEEEALGADLGMWEEVAPAVGQVLSHVNELNTVVAQHFPVEDSSEVGNALDESLAEMGIGLGFGANSQAADAVRRGTRELREQVAQFGMGVRRPEVVGSRWALLSHLQGSIGRFSTIIGDMVFESANAFGEVSRAEVVPFHSELLKESLTLRRAMVDLSRVASLYVEKLKNALLSEMPPLLLQLERDLNSFSKTAAYRSLWAPDKKEMLTHRARLRALAADAEDAELIRSEVTNFAAYVGKLGAVNERAVLREHDREVAANCTVRLEQAEQVRELHPNEAAQLMTEVLRDAWQLYGRDPEFDSYLRKVKKRGSVTFTPSDLKSELEMVTMLVSRVPLALLD